MRMLCISSRFIKLYTSIADISRVLLLLNNKYTHDTRNRVYALSHYEYGRCLIDSL